MYKVTVAVLPLTLSTWSAGQCMLCHKSVTIPWSNNLCGNRKSHCNIAFIALSNPVNAIRSFRSAPFGAKHDGCMRFVYIGVARGTAQGRTESAQLLRKKNDIAPLCRTSNSTQADERLFGPQTLKKPLKLFRKNTSPVSEEAEA